MTDSDSEEEDLPSPDRLFDRLLSSTRGINKQQSINKPTTTTTNTSLSVTPCKKNNKERFVERRSSPRIRVRREEQVSSRSREPDDDEGGGLHNNNNNKTSRKDNSSSRASSSSYSLITSFDIDQNKQVRRQKKQDSQGFLVDEDDLLSNSFNRLDVDNQLISNRSNTPPPQVSTLSPPPQVGTITTSTSNHLEEILIIETTDDEQEQQEQDQEQVDESIILPVLEPDFGSSGIGGGRRGSAGYYSNQGTSIRNDDVWENDGVLIYDPTPKKRPTKLRRNPTTTPRSFNNDPPPKRQGVVLEIDLTGDSSSEEEEEVVSRKTLLLPSSSYNSRNLLFPSTSTSSSSSASSLTKETNLTPTTTTTTTKRRTASPTKKKKQKNSSTPLKSKHTSDSDSDSDSDSIMTRKLTKQERLELPFELIKKLDKLVFKKNWKPSNPLSYYSDEDDDDEEEEGCVVKKKRGLPEGLEIIWNNRLRNTAGRAKWKKVKTTTSSSPSKLETTSTTTTTKIRNECSIELSTKVLDTREKLFNTLSHELCHIAVWILSSPSSSTSSGGEGPHGNQFKLWGKRCMLFGQIKGLKITTTHSYQIDYKFRWKCLNPQCGKIFGRHSNSINIETHGCPCGSKLVRIDKDGNIKQQPVLQVPPPSTPNKKDGNVFLQTPQKKKKNEWLEFVATESPKVRKENNNNNNSNSTPIAQSEVLKLVAMRWKLFKQQQQQQQAVDRSSSIEEEEEEEKGETELERAMKDLKV
ncbi:hypothetical protein JCM3765_002438 [Sporobolomyces pararoseus]